MNKRGINFDIGLPLEKKEEFEILHINYLSELETQVTNWLKDENASSLLIAGQIGVGKSTFINKLFVYQTNFHPDIHIKLDQLYTKTKGSYYGILLGNLIKLSIENKLDLSIYEFDILYKDITSDINSYADLLLSDKISLSHLTEQSQLYLNIEQNIVSIQKQLIDIINKNIKVTNRKLLIFAEGIDKFNPNQTVELYEDLEGFLNFIESQKVLYEANLIHLLENSPWVQNSEKLIVPNANDEIIYQMLIKRLGIYSETMQNLIPIVIKNSGGNFRQALKLLVETEFAKRKLKSTDEEALDYAIKRVKNDYFSYVNIPFELLKVIHRDKFIHSGTFKFEEKMTDSYPVFRNLILIQSYQEEGKWSAIVNPLFQKEIEKYSPDSEYQQSNEFIKFNLTEILDKLATYFLESNKKEIVIILYDDIEVAHIIDDYLVGKAGSYDEVYYEDIEVKNKEILPQILEEYPRIPFTGQSFFFEKKLNDKTIMEIEKLRDRLIMKNMVWWIKSEHIKNYLKQWAQLRQFIKVFDLKKDILNYINPEDIEQDIEDLELLDYNKEQNEVIKKRLERVLIYLRKKQNA
jgi:hypothetical protein